MCPCGPQWDARLRGAGSPARCWAAVGSAGAQEAAVSQAPGDVEAGRFDTSLPAEPQVASRAHLHPWERCAALTGLPKGLLSATQARPQPLLWPNPGRSPRGPTPLPNLLRAQPSKYWPCFPSGQPWPWSEKEPGKAEQQWATGSSSPCSPQWKKPGQSQPICGWGMEKGSGHQVEALD